MNEAGVMSETGLMKGEESNQRGRAGDKREEEEEGKREGMGEVSRRSRDGDGGGRRATHKVLLKGLEQTARYTLVITPPGIRAWSLLWNK